MPGRMGTRLVASVREAWPEFRSAGGPILDVGCGDGLGMETFLSCAAGCGGKALKAKGIEVSGARVEVARSLGLNVEKGTAEAVLPGLPAESYEIFCSHTLEHTMDRAAVLRELWRVGRRLVWIAVPLERGGRSGNKAHFSPVGSLQEMASWVPPEWGLVRLEQRFNLEQEGVLVCKRLKV
jgi:SAM-dependent methyltransferase